MNQHYQKITFDMKRNSFLIVFCLLSFLGYTQNSIEGIVAVVGNKVILKSAVETQYIQMQQLLFKIHMHLIQTLYRHKIQESL